MNSTAKRALVWKEWRESRAKWFFFLVAFHLPLMIVLAKIGFDPVLRSKLFLNSGGSLLVSNLLEFVNLQYIFTMTIGAFLIAFYSASGIVPEFEDRRIFFLFEQPLQRASILRLKFLFGTAQILGLICIPVFIHLSVLYFLIVSGAKEAPFPGSGPLFFQTCAQTATDLLLTCSLGIAVFSGAFLLSLVFEKWWVGVIIGSLSLFGILFTSGGSLHALLLQNSKPFHESGSLALSVLFILAAVVLYQISEYLFRRKEFQLA